MWEYTATVDRVVDADTVDLDIDLGFEVHTKTRIRLAGIDAWEVRCGEREKGLAAKRRLIELLEPERQVVLRTEKAHGSKGKYGRWLGTLFIEYGTDLVNLNERLVAEGHARFVSY